MSKPTGHIAAKQCTSLGVRVWAVVIYRVLESEASDEIEAEPVQVFTSERAAKAYASNELMNWMYDVADTTGEDLTERTGWYANRDGQQRLRSDVQRFDWLVEEAIALQALLPGNSIGLRLELTQLRTQ